MRRNLLIVNDGSVATIEFLGKQLPPDAGFNCQYISWDATAQQKIRSANPDLIIASALQWPPLAPNLFDWLRAHPLPIPTLAILPNNLEEDLARAAYELADDFIFWPPREGEFRRRVERMLGNDSQTIEAVHSRLTREIGLAQLVGDDPALRKVLEQLPVIAPARAPVLLSGETGTGKEVCARAIHHLSPRADSPFIPVECGAIPDHLVENELFGHARGAYTDARNDQKGLVALAEGGTLFLDEIDSLSPAAQAKVLRFLQDGTYRALGAEEFSRADVRIIAATNRDLKTLIQQKEFRSDLYFRLNVLHLSLPPLRDRRGDIGPLARHFLEIFSAETGRARKVLSPGALRMLELYDWPGNVRELRNVVLRAMILSPSQQILPSHVALGASVDPQPPATMNFKQARRQTVENFERVYVEELLRKHQGNITRAAREAGQDRRAFGRLAKRYGLRRDLYQTSGTLLSP